jgi:hypothetical protein
MRGRKPKAEQQRLTSTLMVRMTAAQKQAIDAVAEAFQLRPSVWARIKLLHMAALSQSVLRRQAESSGQPTPP